MLENFIGHECRTLSLSIRFEYSLYIICDSAVFSTLHDQLASLYIDRHAQLTRCFSAVAELLVAFICLTRSTIFHALCATTVRLRSYIVWCYL